MVLEQDYISVCVSFLNELRKLNTFLINYKAVFMQTNILLHEFVVSDEVHASAVHRANILSFLVYL